MESDSFRRSIKGGNCHLAASLNGPNDPIVNLVSSLLASRIIRAEINARNFYMGDYGVCAALLSRSSIDQMNIRMNGLEDPAEPAIISLASRTKEIVVICDWTRLSDPAAFIERIAEECSVLLGPLDITPSSFFRLPRAFWQQFLNENSRMVRSSG
ncbi:hypothetical protein PMAYCL1PPCAC_01023 [Pristionchus mayeri]|uniref:Uncharacterized protein n=1 Tax=Pristionchus mayeri TaxID=1317129 RepID=A0AAN5BZA4_9BILA|nr:hypothetical protein PMAYCL1PPCAC_01023 [Pristionchus mayeri]